MGTSIKPTSSLPLTNSGKVHHKVVTAERIRPAYRRACSRGEGPPLMGRAFEMYAAAG